jgi:GTP-binding protein
VPGYGFARREKRAGAGPPSPANFDALARDYFGRGGRTALVLVDARHPGLGNDRAAWQWIRGVTADTALVATKTDKLARGERIRAMRQLESVFEVSVLPVSAVTGEGLDELWKLIDRLANNSSPRDSRRPPSRMALPLGTSPRKK